MSLPKNIWCIGRNYSEHAKELGNAVPTKPMIFLKSVSCLTHAAEIILPSYLSEAHHELELVLKFTDPKAGGFCFDQVALGLDLTDRIAQTQLKSQGHPWELAKSFQNAAPLTGFIPTDAAAFERLTFELHVNGEVRQQGSPGNMIFPPVEIARYLLQHFPVQKGDYLFTGTPAGVGPLHRGDAVKALLRRPAEERSGILIQQSWKIT